MPEWFWPLGGAGLVAGVVTGALGYGFSSISVPAGLLWFPNRVLNPGLVLIELWLNATVVWSNRAALPSVWPRVRGIVLGVAPGVVLGALIVARVNELWLRGVTYGVLLPLVLAQAAGWRRPIALGRCGAGVVGAGVGTLYAVTTISGPPLAALLNNQGLAGAEFRAGLGAIRLCESALTAVAYTVAGLFVLPSLAPAIPLAIGAAFGLPVGARVVRNVGPAQFGRLAMSVDAVLVAYGLARVVLR